MAIIRRMFLGSTAAALALAPAVVSTQQPGKVFRIGYANLRAGPGAQEEAFLRGLRDLGYVVGGNLIIEYRWADNDLARFQAQVEELVRLKVDVIVTAVTPGVRAAMRATNTIPIVIAVTADAVRTGLVAGLSHPGGNVTGLSLVSTDLAQKRLQLVQDTVPGVTRVAILASIADRNGPATAERIPEVLIAETEAAGRQLGIDVIPQTVANRDELPRAFAEFARRRAQALIVQANAFTFKHRATIVRLAAEQRLPDMHEIRAFVDDGGLVSYGPDIPDLYRRAATYVDKILRGAKPADLPVEQPTKFQLIVNLKTAKALGLVIPPSILALTDDVIE